MDSELLITAVGSVVRRKLVTPEQVVVHDLERGAQGPTTTKIVVSEQGYLKGLMNGSQVSSSRASAWWLTRTLSPTLTWLVRTGCLSRVRDVSI